MSLSPLQRYEVGHPWVDWRDPVPVEVPGQDARLCCRVCIAERGLKGREVASSPFCFDERSEFERHFERHLTE